MFSLFKMRLMALIAAGAAATVTAPAYALTATDLEPISTEITTAIGVLTPWALVLLASVLGALVVFGLIKKFTSKAV